MLPWQYLQTSIVTTVMLIQDNSHEILNVNGKVDITGNIDRFCNEELPQM